MNTVKTLLRILKLTLFIFILHTPSMGWASTELTPLNMFNVSGGYTYDIQLVGDRAYVADYNLGLKVLNVSDLENPEIIGEFSTVTSLRDVKIQGDTTYAVSATNMGLSSFDTSDLSNTLPMDSFLQVNCNDVEFQGQYAYFACVEFGIYIVDVSDPSNFQYYAYIDGAGLEYDIEIENNRAYVLNIGEGIRVYDISDPANAIFLAEYTTNLVSAKDIEVLAGRVYIANGTEGLKILNANDLGSIEVLGTYTNWDLASSLFISSDDTDTLYLVDQNKGFEVLDISDFDNITQLAYYENENSYYTNISVQSGIVALANTDGDGLVLFDLNEDASDADDGPSIDPVDAMTITKIGSFDVGFQISDINFGTNQVYLQNYSTDRVSEIKIYEIESLTTITEHDALRIDHDSAADASTLFATSDGDNLFVFQGTQWDFEESDDGNITQIGRVDTKFYSYDMSNPASPELKHSQDFNSHTSASEVLYMNRKRIVIGAASEDSLIADGYTVFDASNPSDPNELSWISSDFASGLRSQDYKVEEDKLTKIGEIFDISKPDDITKIDFTGNNFSLAANNSLVIDLNVTDGNTVIVHTIDDENNIEEVSEISDLPNNIKKVYLRGQVAVLLGTYSSYINGEIQNILFYDLSDPSHPVLIGEHVLENKLKNGNIKVKFSGNHMALLGKKDIGGDQEFTVFHLDHPALALSSSFSDEPLSSNSEIMEAASESPAAGSGGGGCGCSFAKNSSTTNPMMIVAIFGFAWILRLRKRAAL